MSSRSFMSPIGAITVTGGPDIMQSVTISGADSDLSDAKMSRISLLLEAEAQITAYLRSNFTNFDLPLAPATTPRGEALRAAIAGIAHGDTASYGELARRHESGPRAIGQACRRNPFPIVIPCHRVIGAGGAIGHYSGGAGIETKRWLLNHESGKDAAWAR